MSKILNKKIIVISAVSLFEGGTLTILNTNLAFANDYLSVDYNIIVLVYKKSLFDLDKFSNITFEEFPQSRSNYFVRLYLEYFHFQNLSKKWDPYLWFSLHDITPNVKAEIRAVYCHNPSPFKPKLISDLYFQPTLFFFSLFYKLLYQINIKKNDYVVVQQIWLKNEFIKLFGLNKEKILVCYPESKKEVVSNKINSDSSLAKDKGIFTFFYPALARPFKNFEVIGEAIKVLEKRGVINYRVVITIKGDENNYAKHIYKKYNNLKQMHFVGMLSFADVEKMYEQSHALLFPSTLETWGLPITEFKAYDKPILLSKLPYAFETLGQYDKGSFFNPSNPTELAEKMELLINNGLNFDSTSKNQEQVLTGWSELFHKILAK
ncbi:glycosyltransferase [Flavobacterium sp. GSP14]|uniref:glycosyltransferase n=1 Tax=Flavobacterium sp. GSP14 TaxID=3401734 RepID=UPI003AAE323A